MPRVLKEVAERGQVVFALLGVYTVVYGYEVNIVLCEHDLRVHSYLKVVTSKSGHILDDYPLDNTGFYSLNHSLEVRAFKCRAGVTIVYKELIVRIAVLLGIVQKDFLLRRDLSRWFSAKEYQKSNGAATRHLYGSPSTI